MCDPATATMAAVTLAGTAASIGATHMASKKQEQAQKKAFKLERERAAKLEGIGDENLKLFEEGVKDTTGPADAEAVAGREQAKAQALATSGPGVEMQLPAGQSQAVSEAFGKSIETGKADAAKRAAAGNALSAFGDRLGVGRRAMAITGSKIASNNNAAQVLASTPYFVQQQGSPLADILGAAGQMATLYGVMGAPGLAPQPTPAGRPRAPIIGPNGMAGTV